MAVEIMLTIVLTAVIQSLFGAGILLFGTPLLLLFGHEFVDVLVVLLPVSLGVNLMQIVKHHTHVDWGFYRKIVMLTLPPIALFLFLVTHVRINIGLVVGPFLLFFALKEWSAAAGGIIERLMRHETLYFVAIGVVHGLSNLGGSLLTALVHHKNYPKDVARVTVAICYATFAVVQLLTLYLFSAQQIDVPVFDNLIYLTIAVMVFGLIDEALFSRINAQGYRRIFALFLALSGVVLMAKSL